ncbi:MAG: chorismate synthase [Candidatus Altiarchaeota archaeon]|nr:chorismate synthase [Candidatus Altiarchaeota archaeon]
MNTIGRMFRATTWGESHGRAVGCVVDGCPSNLQLTTEDIQRELDRRKPGQSSVTTSRGEKDRLEVLSGLFEGRTLGTPISMLVWNKDADSSKYEKLRDVVRPGHADLAWRMKYGVVDFRGGGRSSARETVGRVAAGAVAKKLLSKLNITTVGFAREIAGIRAGGEANVSSAKVIDSNSVRTIDLNAARLMERAIIAAKEDNDSVGGIVECASFGVPPGLGEPVFGKLSSDLASAVMSIPGVKGFEIGCGFALARMNGSESNDPFILSKGLVKTRTNNSGGILGGISNGMPLVVRAAFKPTSSIAKKQKTVNLKTNRQVEIQVEGRHDPCIVPRAVPIVEAMVNLVLADHGLMSGVIPREIR